jgi:superfamily II RNA helicase
MKNDKKQPENRLNADENTMKELLMQLTDYKKRFKELTEENKKLKKQLEVYLEHDDDYSGNWSWTTKIAFVIKTAGRPLHATEILALLETKEPELDNKVDKLKFLSAFLTEAKKNSRLYTYKVGGIRGNYYYLPEWNDPNCNLSDQMRKKINLYIH